MNHDWNLRREAVATKFGFDLEEDYCEKDALGYWGYNYESNRDFSKNRRLGYDGQVIKYVDRSEAKYPNIIRSSRTVVIPGVLIADSKLTRHDMNNEELRQWYRTTFSEIPELFRVVERFIVTPTPQEVEQFAGFR